jgi:hypothetical protein
MIKKIIITVLLILPFQINYGQRNFLENICQYNFKNNIRTKNLDIKYFIPCEWLEEESNFPDLLKIYTHYFENGDYILTSIAFKEFNTKIKKADEEIALSNQELKKAVNAWGEYISYRKLNLNGKLAAEIIFKGKTNNPLKFTTYMAIMFYHGTKLITISYCVGSIDEDNCFKIFNKYQPLFNYLTVNTKIN